MADTRSVEIQMADIMDEVGKTCKGVLKTQSEEVAKEAAEKLRSTSPKRKGKYAKGWKVTRQKDSLIVHNATDYQLTHLLENGHVIRNKKGTYGRTTGNKHIKPVEEWAQDELPRQIMKELDKKL